MINISGVRYAEAIFLVGTEDGTYKEIFNDLNTVIEAINSSDDLNKVLKSPVVSKEEKKEIIHKIFSSNINTNLNNFLKILIEKDRISELDKIQKHYKELLNEKENIMEGTVTSAVPMNEIDIKELEVKLSTKYSKTIKLNNVVDKSVLGGILVKLGNEQIDGTLRTRLANMRENLSQVIS